MIAAAPSAVQNAVSRCVASMSARCTIAYSKKPCTRVFSGYTMAMANIATPKSSGASSRASTTRLATRDTAPPIASTEAQTADRPTAWVVTILQSRDRPSVSGYPLRCRYIRHHSSVAVNPTLDTREPRGDLG